MRIVGINEKQFTEFASKHKYRNYYQTTEYGKVMRNLGYNVQYIGIITNQKNLIGASLILYKEVFMHYKEAYAPRGILFDYDKAEDVKELVVRLKEAFGKKGVISLKIDPYIPSTIRDKEGNIINFNNQIKLISTNLIHAGFVFKGKTAFFETRKPRWQAITVLNKDIREIFSSFDKRTRHKIRKATASGVEIIKSDNIQVLYQLIKKKTKNPIKYYQLLTQEYGKNCDIYYARLNTQIYVVNSRRAYEKEMSKNDKLAQLIQQNANNVAEQQELLNKKMESDRLLNTYKNHLVRATELLKNHPKGIILAGVITLKYDNAAYLIIDGYDKKYSKLNANYLLRWHMINEYNKQGLKYINLNGIVGEFKKLNDYSGLNESKLGFNASATEYIGEFDIVLNNFGYKMNNKFYKK